MGSRSVVYSRSAMPMYTFECPACKCEIERKLSIAESDEPQYCEPHDCGCKSDCDCKPGCGCKSDCDCKPGCGVELTKTIPADQGRMSHNWSMWST